MIIRQTARHLFAWAVTMLLVGWSMASAQNFDAWLRESGLGAYAPEVEDWDAIHEAAQAEPPLIVFASTSRVHAFIEAFEEQWPGVTAEAVQAGGPDMIERLNREWQAGLRNAGVIDLAGPESYAAIPPDSFVAYLPPELASVYPERYVEPVLTVAVSLSGWAYNPERSPLGPPFRSLWDLTTEDFRGRVVLTDPIASSSAGEQLVGTVARADELAADYESRFGAPLQLEERDAGFEWLRRLLENDPIVVDDWRPAAEILTNNAETMVAQMNFIRMVSTLDGTYSMSFASGITPTDAVAAPRWQAIGAFTPSPNAAKLFIRTMMTVEAGRPYFSEGFMSPRTDWIPEEDWMQLLLELDYWDPDPEFTLQRGHEVIDFWLLHSR